MQKISEIFDNKIRKFSNYSAYLSLIIGIAILIRFYYYPTEVPLNSDALYYF